MESYNDVIEKFLFQTFPAMTVKDNVRFEALSAEVFGSKQRRYGPMPSPEVQVSVREYIRSAEHYDFLVPWGSSKQGDGDKLDILELMALRQLLCLKEGLARFGKTCTFWFRVEDLTDRFLFGDKRVQQIGEYRLAMSQLIPAVLGDSGKHQEESWFSDWETFAQLANRHLPVFYNYLRGDSCIESVERIGWKGTLPQEQLDYYYSAFKAFYPNSDPKHEAAKYFSATLARVKLKMTAAPEGNYLSISFAKPVPGSPMTGNRLYYRTIPERHTNLHKAPWMGKGYFEIDDGNSCIPRYMDNEEYKNFTQGMVAYNDFKHIVQNTVKFEGVQIDAPYHLV